MNQQLEPTVVLLHGLGRTKFSMYPLARHLKAQNLRVINFGYNSRKQSIGESALKLHEKLENLEVSPDSPLSFITHSLGGLVVRELVSQFNHRYLFQRVVMLGPPNQGAQIARFLSKIPGNRFVFGPVLKEVAELDLPRSTEQIQVGVIAGGLGNSFGYLPFVSGDNDGIVSVEETKLEGMADFVLLRCPHPILMLSPSVWKHAVRFLEHGTFQSNEREE